MGTTILSIPAELQKAIAEFLKHDQDVLQFRQTCRELCAASHDTFVQRFFTTRTILYTKQDLQLLHTLSAQRHLFGKLRSIDLRTLATLPMVDANPRPKQALDYMHFAQKIMEATQFDFDEVAVLTQILDNFAIAGSRPSFYLENYSHLPGDRLVKVPGLSKLSERTLRQFNEIGLISPGSKKAKNPGGPCALTSLTLASASSKAPITGLNFNRYVPSIFSKTPQVSEDIISRSWSSLKNLTLSFPHPVDSQEMNDCVQQLDSATKDTALQYVGLCYFDASTESSKSLLAFLYNHRKSLKKLGVVASWWPTESAFYDFAESLADILSLESLQILNTQLKEKEISLLDDIGDNNFVFRDSNTMADELRRLRKRTRFAPFVYDESESEFSSDDDSEDDEHDYEGGELDADDALFFKDLGSGKSLLTGLDAEEQEDYDSEEDEGKFDMDGEEEEEEYDGEFQDTFDVSTSAEDGSQELYNFGGMAPMGGEEDHQQTLEDWF